jgi:hypothetical protein
MTGFTQVFGAQPIYSAQPSLLALALTANVTLDWPLEAAAGPNVLATILDVTPDAPGRVITMPDARQGTPGYAVTFTNAGASTFTVNDNTGAGLLAVASGERWTVYLRTNLTQAGTWGSFQQGTGTSSANAGALAGAGLKAIGTTLDTRMQVSSKAVNYVILDADRAVIVAWIGGLGQFTLPDPAAVGSDWYCGIKNAGTGSLTVVPTAGLIDGSGSLVMSTGESAFLYSNGANFFTVGFGQEINSVFDFISISIAGTGAFTLAGVQLNRVSYRLTGVLTGNRDIIVPATTQQYWIDNETTGAFTVTVKCTGGVDAGKTIAQGNRNIFYCDGANVLDAVSGAFTPPLPVASGGTNAVTASGARTNLGSTAVGDAVFTAVSTAAARAALGSTTVGDAIFIAASTSAARSAMGIFSVYKAANETRASTIVLADDAELFVANLPINKSYEFEIFISWTQQGVISNGLQAAPVITGVGTALIGWDGYGTTNTAAGNVAPVATVQNYSAAMAQTIGAGGATGQVMRIKGVCTTGANVGRLALQWAQASSNVTGTRVFAGSWMRVSQLT